MVLQVQQLQKRVIRCVLIPQRHRRHLFLRILIFRTCRIVAKRKIRLDAHRSLSQYRIRIFEPSEHQTIYKNGVIGNRVAATRKWRVEDGGGGGAVISPHRIDIAIVHYGGMILDRARQWGGCGPRANRAV